MQLISVLPKWENAQKLLSVFTVGIVINCNYKKVAFNQITITFSPGGSMKKVERSQNRPTECSSVVLFN